MQVHLKVCVFVCLRESMCGHVCTPLCVGACVHIHLCILWCYNYYLIFTGDSRLAIDEELSKDDHTVCNDNVYDDVVMVTASEQENISDANKK